MPIQVGPHLVWLVASMIMLSIRSYCPTRSASRLSSTIYTRQVFQGVSPFSLSRVKFRALRPIFKHRTEAQKPPFAHNQTRWQEHRLNKYGTNQEIGRSGPGRNGPPLPRPNPKSKSPFDGRFPQPLGISEPGVHRVLSANTSSASKISPATNSSSAPHRREGLRKMPGQNSKASLQQQRLENINSSTSDALGREERDESKLNRQHARSPSFSLPNRTIFVPKSSREGMSSQASQHYRPNSPSPSDSNPLLQKPLRPGESREQRHRPKPPVLRTGKTNSSEHSKEYEGFSRIRKDTRRASRFPSSSSSGRGSGSSRMFHTSFKNEESYKRSPSVAGTNDNPGDSKEDEDAKEAHSTTFPSKYWNDKEGRYDLKKVDKALGDRIEELALHILGEPNLGLSSGDEYRYGNKGSLCVTIAGGFRGRWYDFETGEGGGALKLIQNRRQSDFKSALQYALHFIETTEATREHHDTDDRNSTPRGNAQYGESSTSSSGLGQRSLSKDERRNRTREYAMKLYMESTPIHGTVGERYLRMVRGIQKPVNPRSVRFHPSVLTGKADGYLKLPALIAVLRDTAGNPASVQATYLDPRTAQKWPNLSIPKRTYGALKGAVVTISDSSDRQNKVTFVAEGLETALSIAQVVNGQHIVATLGKHNVKHILHHNLKDTIVLCVDNDGNATFSDTSIPSAIMNLVDAGKKVYLAIPPDPKSDFNDVLRAKSPVDYSPGEEALDDPLAYGKEQLMRYLSLRKPWNQVEDIEKAVETVRLQQRERQERARRRSSFLSTDD